MKTFDIAIKYIRNVDLSEVDILHAPPSAGGGFSSETGESMPEIELPQWMKNVMRVKESFDNDPDNTVSNDYYRSVVFECALYHMLDHTTNRYSCWTEACDIVTDNDMGIFNIFSKKYGNTNIPDVMMEKWLKYCKTSDPKPFYLQNEITPEILMTAYSYIKDKIA